MVKVLQIIDNLDLGGAERMAVNMANAFTDNGIANVLCATRSGGAFLAFLDTRVPHYVLNKKNVLDVRAFIWLVQIIIRHKPTTIHAHSTSFFWAFLIKLFFRRITLVWHDHRGFNKHKLSNTRPLLGFLSKQIDGIIVVNEEMKERNLRYTSVPESRIRFIKNFPDVRLQKKDDKSDEELNILCLANLRPEKDHSMLIQAFAQLIRSRPSEKINLWLAGKTFDQNYVDTLHVQVNELNVANEVIFLGNVSDTQTLLSKADIGVLSSQFEGLPVSLLEYGLAALPVLATDTGHCSEVLENGRCGCLVKPHDSSAFASALNKMIDNWEQSLEMGKRLRVHVLEEYGSLRFVQEYVDFLHTLHYPGVNVKVPAAIVQ